MAEEKPDILQRTLDSISSAGRRQLEAEARNWEPASGVIGRLVLLAQRG